MIAQNPEWGFREEKKIPKKKGHFGGDGQVHLSQLW